MAADEFAALEGRRYMVRPDETRDYERMFKELRAEAGAPECILHLWTAPHAVDAENAAAAFESHQSAGSTASSVSRRGWKRTTSRVPFRSASFRVSCRRCPKASVCAPRRARFWAPARCCRRSIRISIARASTSGTGRRTRLPPQRELSRSSPSSRPTPSWRIATGSGGFRSLSRRHSAGLHKNPLGCAQAASI